MRVRVKTSVDEVRGDSEGEGGKDDGRGKDEELVVYHHVVAEAASVSAPVMPPVDCELVSRDLPVAVDVVVAVLWRVPRPVPDGVE